MCLVHIGRCPLCSQLTTIPFLCPTKELGFRAKNESGFIYWDTACNKKWCQRNKNPICHIPLPWEGPCETCTDSSECNIEFVNFNCQYHWTKKDKKEKAGTFKSMFRAQLNIHSSGEQKYLPIINFLFKYKII